VRRCLFLVFSLMGRQSFLGRVGDQGLIGMIGALYLIDDKDLALVKRRKPGRPKTTGAGKEPRNKVRLLPVVLTVHQSDTMTTQDRRKQIEEQLNTYRQDSLRSYQRNADVIHGLHVIAADHSCHSCKALAASGVHPLTNPPVPPNAECSSSRGWCRCTYIPVTR